MSEESVVQTEAGNKIRELDLKLDGSKVRKLIDERVKEGISEVLQTVLEEEAKDLCQAESYERTNRRKDHRNGYRQRKLVTRVGEVVLKMPRLRELAFTTSVVERYQRRECSVDEALLEMYFAGVSTRRVEDITRILFGDKVSASQMSELNKKVGSKIEAWRRRPLKGKWPYLYLDGLVVPRRWDGEIQNVSILVAIGINEAGMREVIAVEEGLREDKASWVRFLRELKERGLTGTHLIIADRCTGLVEAAREIFPKAGYQRCIFHFFRNILSQIPRNKVKKVGSMLKAIFAQESKTEALVKAKRVIEQNQKKYPEAMKTLEKGIQEAVTYYAYPQTHWRKLRTNNPMERLLREIRRRTNVVGAFPDGKSALLLIAARARYVSEKAWTQRKYVTFGSEKEILAA